MSSCILERDNDVPVRGATRSHIENLRKELAEQLQGLSVDLTTVSQRQRKYLFDGEWRTVEQIDERCARLKRKDRQVVFELFLLLLVLAGATGFLILALYSVCCSV